MSDDVSTRPPEKRIGEILTQVMLCFSGELQRAARTSADQLSFACQEELADIFDDTILKGLRQVGLDQWEERRRYAFGRIREFCRELAGIDATGEEITPEDLRDALGRVSRRVQEALRRLDPEIREYLDNLPEGLSDRQLAELINPLFPFCPEG